MENVPRRNQDFHDICRRVIFSDTVGDRYYPIFQHEYIHIIISILFLYHINIESIKLVYWFGWEI